MRSEADRDLLFGILALQNGLIDEIRLFEAFESWTRDGDRRFAEHLVARGALDAAQIPAVEAMVALHLAMHGDAARSLASIPAGHRVRERLARFSHRDAEATRTHGAAGDPSAERAAGEGDTTRPLGTPSSAGRRFRVLRPHARGGLGAVYVAMDEELHREVALKQILESHADNPISRQRFVLEAQITGGLEHPGIVPVYGLGTYEDGRPYYAMRFIQGESLGEAIELFHADAESKHDAGRRSLELHKLLRRFLDVCNAIEYAHARGVLHRDIKPGNVIVGRHGETLVVDWGLAKAGPGDASSAIEPLLVTGSLSGDIGTLHGSTLGTPAYMSPEQAEGRLERMGPHSDVYSLGATLYSVLTGRPPVAGDDLGAVLQSVERGDFPPPRQIVPWLDEALESVCLKAMARRPEDRYPSSRALADDVERWMADEPVTAWREPVSRRARRWARRNRTVMAAAAVALVGALAGLAAVAGVQTRANGKLRLANDATSRALAETEEAREQAEAVSDFLVQAFRSPDPTKDGRQVKVIEVLDSAGERLDEELTAASPATRGTLLHALGLTYKGLGIYDKSVDVLSKARAMLESALGPDHALTLESCNDLANAYCSAGRTKDATALHESTLRLMESTLGADDPRTLQCRNDLGVDYWYAGRFDEAIAMQQETLRLREAKLGPDDTGTLQTRQNLAIALNSAGQLPEAIAMFEEVLRLQENNVGPNHPHTLETRNDLASAYREVGRVAEATDLDEQLVKAREATLGPDHPETLASRSNLALDYAASGRMEEAIELGREILAIRRAKLGPDHRDTLIAALNLADTYRDTGRSAEAIALNTTMLERMKVTLGPDHPYTLICASNLAASYVQAGRFAQAVPLLDETIRSTEAKLGAASTVTLWNRGNLATVYESREEWGEAESLLRESLARRREAEKPGSPLIAGDLARLGRNLLAQSRATEAEAHLRESLAIYEKALPDDWKRYEALSLLGGALAAQGRHVEAEPLLVSGYTGMQERESRITALDKPRLREAGLRVNATPSAPRPNASASPGRSRARP